MKFFILLFVLLAGLLSNLSAQTSFNISNQATGDTLFTIDENGQVGIGTTAPSVDLEVRGSIPDDASRVYLTNSDDSHNLFLYSGRENVPNPLISWSATDALRFATFETGLTEIMRLTNSGNLGLGTSDPESRLDIQMFGNGLWQRAIRVLNPDLVATDGLFLGLGREDNFRNIGFMYFRYDDHESESNRLSFGLYGVNDVLNVMGSGNVGIGTTAPTEMLEVADTIYSSIGGFKFPDQTIQTTAAGGGISGNTLDQAYDQGGAGAGAVINADAGAVEINGPGGLSVAGVIDGHGGLYLNGSGIEGGQGSLVDGDGQGSWIIDNYGSTDNESIRIFRGSGYNNIFNALVINELGNVGIGTGGPSEKLTVDGTIHSDSGGFRFPDGTLQETAVPGGGVSEIGDLTDAITAGNSVFLGAGSGVLDDSSDNNNTAVGIDALHSNTNGYNNTAVGYLSLNTNSTGDANTALGRSALYSSTTGHFNTALGLSALFHNTTGLNNVAVGNSANFRNQEGSENTIVGVQAGYGTALHNKSGNVFLGFNAGYFETGSDKLYIENSNSSTPLIWGDFAEDSLRINGDLHITGNVHIDGSGGGGASSIDDLTDGKTGGNSTFLGENAGYNDDGSNNNNTGLGRSALALTTIGSYNTAVGTSVMNLNSEGHSNTALGYYALYSNTTGDGNVGIGLGANRNNQEGSENTIIGYNAGGGSTAHSKSGNIFLGYMAGRWETGNNKLYIENSDSDEPLIGGDFATDDIELNGDVYIRDRLGVGTTSPGAGMHLVGDGYPNSFLYLESLDDADAGIRLYEGTTANWHIFNNASLDGLQIYNNSGQNVFFADRSTAYVGIGTTTPASKLDVRGNVTVRNESTGDIVIELGTGLDYAEGFDVSDKTNIEPGTVLCIDEKNPGNLKMSEQSYDYKVAGIVAGANALGSGVTLGSGQHDFNVALAGRVYCNVDASNEEVKAGDLLTTSEVPGFAQKVTDYQKSQGAILGKAMQNLEKGKKGQILVLVTLQ